MHIRCRWCDIYNEDPKKCTHSAILHFTCYTLRGKLDFPTTFPECDTCKDRFKCLTTRNWTEWVKEPERDSMDWYKE